MKYWIIGLGIILLAGIGLFLATGDDEAQEITDTSSNSVAPEQDSQPQNSDNETTEVSAGQYLDYKQELIAENADKDVIIFFHADWCPKCRALEETIKSGTIPENLVILKANYDTETELKQKLGVTIQTTLVQVDKDGNKINLWIADPTDDFEDIQAELL